MAVYVDKMRAQYGRMIMCHMLADTLPELHKMAGSLGISRKWFQYKGKFPHYDICLSNRKRAIDLGAQEVTRRELGLLLKKIKASRALFL